MQLPSKLSVSACPNSYGPRPLLLVSLDGFKPDYLLRNLTPTIQQIANKGVHAEYMLPSYPTVTFPNHYTIVTGLYPEAHGIIANSFYDPVFKERYSYRRSQGREGRWYGGEPIWNTLTRQGKKSATYFWPGSEADINGRRPTIWKEYNESVPYDFRVLEVLKWLSEPEESRPALVTLYLDEPDHASHGYGPNSQEVNMQLDRVDKVIDLLMRGLIERNLIHCVNFMIVSDHGGAEAGASKVIDLKNILPNLTEEANFEYGVVGMIDPKNDSEAVELATMRKLVCQREEMRVYRKEELPKRLHFSKNDRIQDIVIELDPGYTVQFNSTWSLQGQHGYDNYFPSMHALFVAYGPDFKQGIKVEPFQNIELYNLMCYLTGVEPAENNGTWGSLHHLLEASLSLPPLPKEGDPSILRFPKGDLQARWNASGCDIDYPTNHQWMSATLLLTADQEITIKANHLPWGTPLTTVPAGDVSLLFQRTHVTAFSTIDGIPLWTSFTVDTDYKMPHQQSSYEVMSDQWITDVRLPVDASPQCQTFRLLQNRNYTLQPLFPYDTEDVQNPRRSPTYVVSNAIPVHSSLQEHWSQLMQYFLSWSSSGPVNIILGSVYAENDNPHITDFLARGIKVPSDMFAVLTRCNVFVPSLNQCPIEQLDVRALTLHQYQPEQNCLTSEEYFNKFTATVKDVERFSGLTFYQDLPYPHRLNLTLGIHPYLWHTESK
ncbi:ectonucleotide pyrophosphatase phosphodiesterase [Halocaridina rubra]|uniref:Ectonucleotide pyrophosphatase phosphodiesterase n=1 Tax=Halocaridina rubra TaxID=373956 RepID=A0AAN8WRE2_HALRR